MDKAEQIISLMQPSINKGFLLNRSIDEIRKNIDEFLTIKKNSKIIACAGLRKYPQEKIAEIYALVIDAKYYNTGLSNKLINILFEKVKLLGFESVFAISKYGGSFFINKGFEISNIENLPIKRQISYDHQRLSNIYIKFI